MKIGGREFKETRETPETTEKVRGEGEMSKNFEKTVALICAFCMTLLVGCDMRQFEKEVFSAFTRIIDEKDFHKSEQAETTPKTSPVIEEKNGSDTPGETKPSEKSKKTLEKEKELPKKEEKPTNAVRKELYTTSYNSAAGTAQNITFSTVEEGRSLLEEILAEKSWAENVKALVLEAYDNSAVNFEVRDFYDGQNKITHLQKYVNTVANDVNKIVHDPEDPTLAANGWIARANYRDKMVVLKFLNPSNLRHELAHLEKGSFLGMSDDGSTHLGYVLEEGRASFYEGDSMKNKEYVDNVDLDLDLSDKDYLVYKASGTYAVFEEIYKWFIKLGVDVEKVRSEEKAVEIYTEEIRQMLDAVYGEERGTAFISFLENYITYFNRHGVLIAYSDAEGRDPEYWRERIVDHIDTCLRARQGQN